MRLNLPQSEKKQFLRALDEIASELRGIRVSLELLALKERAAPLPEQPDDADFMAQSDEEFANLEKIAQGGPGLPDEGLTEEEAAPSAEQTSRRPAGSFLPRFPQQ